MRRAPWSSFGCAQARVDHWDVQTKNRLIFEAGIYIFLWIICSFPEEQTDLKAQLKIVTDKNANYMRSVIELEEEQRKTGNMRTQLEAYKRQVTDMDAKLTEEVSWLTDWSWVTDWLLLHKLYISFI